MSAEEQKQAAQRGYSAFGQGDVEAAMADISDSVEWVVGGNSSVSGTYKGKDETLGFWAQLPAIGFRTEPSEFLADGNRVVVLSTISAGEESRDVADVLTYDADGKLARFQSFGGEDLLDKVFPK
jgi:uncharacterized protein